MTKSNLFYSFIVLALSACSQEKIVDFYLPTNGNNVSEYVWLDENGNKTENKTTVLFAQVDDNSFKTTKTNSLMEEAKQNLSEKDSPGDVKDYSTYLIKNDELHLVSSNHFNIVTGQREFESFNPTKLILKLPGKSNISEWKEISGDNYNCTSEFTTVEIDGVKKRAIKLTKMVISKNNEPVPDWVNSITYFVKGIGQWKSCMEKTGQVFNLLNRQYSTSDSANAETRKSLSSSKHSNNSEPKVEKIDAVEENIVASPNKSEEESCKKIVMIWNKAHNTKDAILFSDLFTEEVNFYHTLLSKNVLIQNKKDLFKKYPDFNQQIIGEITTERLNDNEVKCSFIKEIIIDGKVTDYPSYLILEKSDDNWIISVEGDLVTDKNIAKKKKT